MRAFVTAAILIFSASLAMAQSGKEKAPRWTKIDEVAFGDYVDAVRSTMQIPGVAISVVHTDKGTVFERGFGQSAEGADIGPDALFILGPPSRTIAALTALSLAEEGKLDLDASIFDVLPPEASISPMPPKPVTVRHLIEHASGLSRNDGLDAAWGDAIPYPLRTSGKPGTQREISALNDMLTAAIIERAAGKPFAEAARALVLEPLGMTRTFLTREDALDAGLGKGHRYWFGLATALEEPAYSDVGIPALFVVSCTQDMAKLLQAQLKAKAEGKPFGIGWDKHTDEEAGPVLTTSGQTTAWSSAMALLPDKDMGIVVMTNINSFDGAGPTAIRDGFAELLLNRTTQVFAFVELILRAGLALFVLIALLDLILQILRWRQANYPRQMPMNQRRTLRLIFGVGLPIALLFGALIWMGLPFGTLFALQPDIALGLFIGCPLAALKSGLKLINDIHKEETIDDI